MANQRPSDGGAGADLGDKAVQALIRPPRLRTDQEATASRLELFFDLAYVLVVLELAATFLQDLTWHGLGVFAGMFTAIWFSWVGFTLYANRFDTDDVVFRIGKLLATLAIAGCAASAAAANAGLALQFAASYLTAILILLLLYIRAWWHLPDSRRTIAVYLATTSTAAVLWAVSLPVGGSVRYVLWAAGVTVAAVGPIVATLRANTLPLHIEHLPERFGLLVILVLGEAVRDCVTGVYDANWSSPSVLVGVAGFAVAGGMWWIYFDVTATRSTDSLEQVDQDAGGPGGAGTDDRHDLFIYGHLPLTIGVVMAGVGTEDLILHTDAAIPSAAGWVLAGGFALFITGAALIVGGTTRRWRTLWPWPVGAIPLIAGYALIPQHSSLLYVGGIAAIGITLAVHGTLRRRAGSNRQPAR
ncbi:MAG: low temperature requirement protein A [Nakamurella sp.]